MNEELALPEFYHRTVGDQCRRPRSVQTVKPADHVEEQGGHVDRAIDAVQDSAVALQQRSHILDTQGPV